ncbi:MAG: hypothetical protein KAH30_05925 [Caldisericia bacterium]|nr:hypothetical protein [Caldisericia bacterium]
MINYNLAIFENLFPGQSIGWMWAAIILFIVIAFSFAIGNMISVKLLKPQFKNAGRIFYGALIWLCTNIVLTLIMFQIKPWAMDGISATVALIYIIIFVVVNLFAFYLVTKYLFDYDWGKAVLAVITPLVVATIIIGILWFAIPGDWVKTALFPSNINLLIW